MGPYFCGGVDTHVFKFGHMLQIYGNEQFIWVVHVVMENACCCCNSVVRGYYAYQSYCVRTSHVVWLSLIP